MIDISVNSIIIEICEELGLEVEQDLYTGDKDKWVTFTIVDERPNLIADDKVISDTTYVNVKISVPTKFNYLKLKNDLRDKLEHRSFFVTSITIYKEFDVDIRNIAFDCEITQERG